MFDGFDTIQADVGGTTIFARRKGHGRPLLLLHGFPETHVMWHRVAPALAERFTISTPDHAPYAKSAIAGGHFFPEQNPDETISELRAFFE